MVNTISTAVFPVLSLIPTGIPRPLSVIVAVPSLFKDTVISSQYPARNSSTELSTISYIK